MEKNQKPLLWSLLALSTCLLGLGLFSLRSEAAATIVGGGATRLAQLSQTVEGVPTLPLSIEGRRLLLDTCEKALQPSVPLVLRFASEEQLQMVVPYCERIAAQSVEASRVDGYAWLVLAMAQARKGDIKGAEENVIRSAQLTPTEGWIAQPRFALVQQHYDDFSETTRSIGDADTLLLLEGSYARVVVRQYIVDTAFRQRAESLIEDQSETVQRRFVSLLRGQVQVRP